MPSEAETDEAETAASDEARQALLDAISTELGETLVGSHLLEGRDLWIRVDASAWSSVGSYLRNRQQFRFFSWLSAIDWTPSPFGRSLDSAVDRQLGLVDTPETNTESPRANSFAGGETRFQILARVHSLTTGLGVTVKADLADEGAPSIATWTHEYPGAAWHEREAWEMFGIAFEGHPGLRHLYLPGDFEGHPLRKDYPLLARLVKPWPGITDVEPMPEAPSTENPEADRPAVPEADTAEADSTPSEESS